MNCTTMKSQMPDLLFDTVFTASEAGAAARHHLAECADCREQWEGMQATMALLDTWQAPDPSPYFDTRMQVLLRQEMAAPPASFWQRIVARITRAEGSSLLAFRPLVASVMTIAIVIGGATYVGVSFLEQPYPGQPLPSIQQSAALSDLQSLDRNAQTIDDLNSLDQQLNDNSTDSNEQ
jgi:predicted anti-sigma-YlaC factor YlaD